MITFGETMVTIQNVIYIKSKILPQIKCVHMCAKDSDQHLLHHDAREIPLLVSIDDMPCCVIISSENPQHYTES